MEEISIDAHLRCATCAEEVFEAITSNREVTKAEDESRTFIIYDKDANINAYIDFKHEKIDYYPATCMRKINYEAFEKLIKFCDRIIKR